MDMNFCRRCGSMLAKQNTHVFTCSEGHTLYANCTPSVGILLLTQDNKLVLARRGIEPHKGMLDTVGGFVDGEETLEEALRREIKEELNLEPSDYTSPTFLCSAVGHYPYENDSLPVLSCFFQAKLLDHAKPAAGDDIEEIITFRINEIKLDEMHDDDVKHAIIQLQKEIS